VEVEVDAEVRHLVHREVAVQAEDQPPVCRAPEQERLVRAIMVALVIRTIYNLVAVVVLVLLAQMLLQEWAAMVVQAHTH
jgi:hypothetical protein